jgi:hypothetical protein
MPFTFSRVLVLVDCVLCAILAVLLLITDTAISVQDALGWLFVALAVYFASLLAP